MLRGEPMHGVPRFDRRTLLLALVLVLIWRLVGQGESSPYEIARGLVTVNDPGDCEFAIGQHAMLMLHPKGEDCVRVRVDLLGKRIRLLAVVED